MNLRSLSRPALPCPCGQAIFAGNACISCGTPLPGSTVMASASEILERISKREREARRQALARERMARARQRRNEQA